MSGNVDKFVEIQREVLAAMRRIFLGNWAAFTLMQDQMRDVLQSLWQNGIQSHRATVRFMEWWLDDFKRARAGFQRMVDEIFSRARRDIEKTKNPTRKDGYGRRMW